MKIIIENEGTTTTIDVDPDNALVSDIIESLIGALMQDFSLCGIMGSLYKVLHNIESVHDYEG